MQEVIDWKSEVLDEHKTEPNAEHRNHKPFYGGTKILSLESTKVDGMERELCHSVCSSLSWTITNLLGTQIVISVETWMTERAR